MKDAVQALRWVQENIASFGKAITFNFLSVKDANFPLTQVAIQIVSRCLERVQVITEKITEIFKNVDFLLILLLC